MEDFDMSAPCTCCGGPRPCPCELMIYKDSFKSTPVADKPKVKEEKPKVVDVAPEREKVKKDDIFYAPTTK